MTYSDAIRYLYGLRWFGTRPGLGNPRRLAVLAGNPQDRLRFIHVAGTNGKGSVCAMLEAIYRAAGLRVGLFTSPHLVAFGERMQVDRRLIDEADVARFVAEMQRLAGSFPAESHPTFFEIVTVMALRHFAEQQCDLVIWETGLGGRLDATNIVTPLASVITNIQLDHQQWLGDTLEQIAAEKAGIIKPRVPVITGTDAPAALEVIRRTARELDAPLTVVTRESVEALPGREMPLSLPGGHQRLNAALAMATVRALAGAIPVPENLVGRSLAGVQWPGRFQVVKSPGGRTLVLDGAHNPAGVETLRQTLRETFPGARPAFVIGILEDKDWREMCRVIAPLARAIYCTPVGSNRSCDPQAVRDFCEKTFPGLTVHACASVEEALSRTEAEPLVVVTGSLHFIGEVMERRQLLASGRGGEQGLNEWDATASKRGGPAPVGPR